MPKSPSLTPGVLLEMINSQIADLSRRRHEDAAEQTALEEQARLLRMGLSTPEAAIWALANRGVRLRGVAVRAEARRRGTMASTRRAES